MKVLVIRFSAMGDIVLTTPLLRGLRKQLNAEVHYATKPCYVSLLAGNPHIQRIHALSGSLRDLAAQLRKEDYDYIIDLHHNLRTLQLRFLLKRSFQAFYKMNGRKMLYTLFKWPALPQQHIVARYWQTLSALNVQPDAGGLEHHIPSGEGMDKKMLPAAFQAGYVAYAIGGAWRTKRLPVPQMIALCMRIDQPVLLLGGETDKAAAEEVIAGLKTANKQACVYSRCGHCSVHQSADLIRQADYVLAHDTGMMHIAAAFKKHIVVIWGNTVPEFGMFPYRTRFMSLQHKGLFCRPCSKIGHKSCPLGHFRCMKDIPMDFPMPFSFSSAKSWPSKRS